MYPYLYDAIRHIHANRFHMYSCPSSCTILLSVLTTDDYDNIVNDMTYNDVITLTSRSKSNDVSLKLVVSTWLLIHRLLW